MVREAGLAAWATETDAANWTRDDLLAHHAIITRIDAAAAGGCLPARFPTWLDAQMLHERRAELTDALARVRGRAELAITAVWRTPASLERASSGATYLRTRAVRLTAARRVARLIEDALGDAVVEVEHRVCPSEAIALSSAFLVPRARAEALKRSLPQETDGVRILVNGPWPPYTFAAVAMPAREE